MKKLAYITATVVFYFLAILLLFVAVFSILSFAEFKFGVQIPFVEIIENHPKVIVPIVGMRINVPLNYTVLIMWTVMMYYVLYFYAFKEFLKVFTKEKMFEKIHIKRLRFFLMLNLLPLIYIIIFTVPLLVTGKPFRLHDDYFIVLAHLVIGFLIYLYLDVLKKGSYVQEENDLTI